MELQKYKQKNSVVSLIVGKVLISGKLVKSSDHLEIPGAPLPEGTQFYELTLETGLKTTVGIKHVGSSSSLKAEIKLSEFCEYNGIKHYAYRGNFSGKEYGWFFVTEYVPGVSILADWRVESDDDLQRIITRGMENLHFMHSNGIYHGNASVQNLATLTNRDRVVEPFLFNFSRSKLFSTGRTPEKFQAKDRDIFTQSIEELAHARGLDSSEVREIIEQYPFLVT